MIKKIIIIGGGIAGLAAAIGLKQKGYAVTVFEKAKQIKPIGSDLGLWPTGLRVLDKLGVYERTHQLSGHYPVITHATEQGELVATTPVSVYQNSTPYLPMNICRYELQNVLLQQLGEEHLVLNKECVDIQEADDQVTVTFQDGSTATADLMIGADGAFSSIRDYVSSDYQIQYTGYISLGGINYLPHEIKYNFMVGKFYSGVFPVGSERQIFFFVQTHADVDLAETYPQVEQQFALFRHHAPILDDMLDKLEVCAQRMNYANYFFLKNYRLTGLKTWHKSRVVLIGEAAQLVGPMLGCATAIILEGVDILIETLHQYPQNVELALQTYERLQMPRAKEIYNLEQKFSGLFAEGKYLQDASIANEFISLLKNDRQAMKG